MKIKFYKQDIKIKLFKIFVFATFLITFKNLSIMRNEVEKSKDLNFFQWEKALRNNPSSKLEIGNYLGEIDESGRPKFGILRVENVEFLPNGIFVGKFGDDGLPHEGELRTPGFVVRLKSLEDGTRFLSQRSLEGGKVQEFQYRDGSWKTLKTIAINGDLLNEKDEIIKKFNEEEISARSITLPSIEEVDKKFLPVKQAFSKLKMVHQDKYLKYQEKLHNEGDIETSEKLQKFKDRLASKEILRSETMFAELTGIKNEDDQ